MKKQYNTIILSRLFNEKNAISTAYVENGKVLASNGMWSHNNWTEAYHEQWEAEYKGSTLYTGKHTFLEFANKKEMAKRYVELCKEQ